MCNHANIESARAALARAAWVRGEAPRYCEGAVTDLLADLRHFCAAAGIEFATCDRLAEMHFEAEIGGAS
jgi:hypothetical protein